MTLYISNPSRQDVVFYFRTAITKDNSGPSSVSIRSGGQVEVGHNWSKEETGYVIQQILRAGGADAAEAHGSMGSTFTGLLYREKAPVSKDEIITANESVEEAGKKRSAEQATRGALAFDRSANQGQRERKVKTTTVEVHQQLPPHQRPTGDEVHFEMSVDPDGTADVRNIPGLT